MKTYYSVIKKSLALDDIFVFMINYFKNETDGRVTILNTTTNKKALMSFDTDKNLTFDVGEINGLFES